MCEYTELLPAGILTRDFEVVGGSIEVSDVLGHGVELNDTVARKYKRAKRGA